LTGLVHLIPRRLDRLRHIGLLHLDGGYVNARIPQARGQAEKTIKEAEGYALDRVNRSQGDASRFLALYEEYSKAKDVTKRRLYLEALREIFPKLGDKYIVDAGQKNLLPLLNLGRPIGGEK